MPKDHLILYSWSKETADKSIPASTGYSMQGSEGKQQQQQQQQTQTQRLATTKLVL